MSNAASWYIALGVVFTVGFAANADTDSTGHVSEQGSATDAAGGQSAETATEEKAAPCVLPRLTSGSSDLGVDPKRLGDPEVFRCLLSTAEKGEDRYAVEWAQILLWEGKIDHA